ncbi:MAG: PAS domain S-box protein, partial [Crocinitomicaceae bacterium]|nr:PAS domain S-box protein [Crocinitomicaceae bacterium]
MQEIENLYELLFENIKEGIVIVNSSGVIEKVNKRLETIFGYDPEELIGKNLEILVPNSFREQHKHHHSSFMQKPMTRTMGIGMTLQGLKKDGSLVDVEISLSYLERDGSKLAVGLVSDITKRVENEKEILSLNKSLERKVEQRTKELRESQKLHQLIARNFPDGTINVFDRELNYIFIEGEELYSMGITSEKLIGTNYLDRLPKRVHEEIRSNLQQVFEGKSVSFQLNLKKNHYQITSVPLLLENGKVEQILVVERNITQQVQLNDQMLESLEKEKALNELKTRFVSMASHEFRTPLSAILSSSDLISKYIERNDLPKTTKHLDRIKTSVHNLIDILSDFLSIDEMESDKVQYNPKPNNIREVFEKAASDLELLLKKDQVIKLEFDLNQEIFLIDPRILLNVLNNLVTNAIKYSEEGDPIEIKVYDRGHSLHFEVRDFG